MQVIERVTFSLASGVTSEVFLEAVEKSNRFLVKQPGFLSRHISQLPQSSEWMDLVFWQDMESALTAAKEFSRSKFTSDFNSKLRNNTVVMSHLLVRHSISVA